MAIRSGRFTVEDASTSFTIIKGRAGAFYRLFNSGKKDFTVTPRSGSGNTLTLKPTFSLDVATGDEVVIGKAAGDAVEGIYDYLDPHADIRSGRFKITSNTTTAHQIIDVRGGNDRAWYRIYNSGEHVIILLEGSDELKRVTKDQSFDFEVGAPKREIFVKSADASHPIEGIYEFLGKED